MSLYDQYKHLLGLPYSAGDQDCYGLIRRYYKEVWDIELENFARPEAWWDDPSFNLICENLATTEWEKVPVSLREVKVGDGLIFSIINGRANHVGVYVGNGNFIHHVLNQFSNEEAYTPKWLSRTLMIVRNPVVTSKTEAQAEQIDIFSLLPNHVRTSLTTAV